MTRREAPPDPATAGVRYSFSMARQPLTTENKRILAFTVSYMVLFTGIAVWRRNIEFLYYMALMTGLVGFAVAYHRRLHMSNFILSALSLVGLLHVMGGNIHIGGRRLYETYLIQDVIRYDNLVHSFGIFVITLTLYSTVVPHLDQTVRGSGWTMSVILVLMAMGVGAFIEVVEFGAVAFLGAQDQVGDYWNNALDLTFNLAGSLVAIVGIQIHRRREREDQDARPRAALAHTGPARNLPRNPRTGAGALGSGDGNGNAGHGDGAGRERAGSEEPALEE